MNKKIPYNQTDHKASQAEYGTMCRMKTTAITCSDLNDLKTYAENGADEVIIAPVDCSFSALSEIQEEKLFDAISTAHQEGMKISFLMNRLFGQSEISVVSERMNAYMQAGVDGVIFADPGLLSAAENNGYLNRMIYQPDTLVTSSYDASFWMEQGLKSVTVSSLITKEQSKRIKPCCSWKTADERFKAQAFRGIQGRNWSFFPDGLQQITVSGGRKKRWQDAGL